MTKQWCPEPESNQRHADFQSGIEGNENSKLDVPGDGNHDTGNQSLIRCLATDDMFASLAPPYRVILADPPWHFATRSAKGDGRSPSQHYQTMTISEITAMPVEALTMRGAHLFLWTSGPYLPAALEVVKSWGFTYSTLAFYWIKTRRCAPKSVFLTPKDLHTGMGYTTRANAEIVIYARKGRPDPALDRSVHSVIIKPVREHSRKPTELQDRIERLFPGPRVELFARAPRAGWDTWGNEKDRFPPEA